MTQEHNKQRVETNEKEQEFLEAWGRIRQQGTAASFKLAHEQGMSATQFALLGLVARAAGREACTISWLAGQTDLDPATVVRSVDLLEKRDLVRRRRDTKDRRLVFVELSEGGHTLQQELQQHFTARLTTIFRSMSEEGQQALLQGLHDFLTLGDDIGV